jgi:hypothetical protein
LTPFFTLRDSGTDVVFAAQLDREKHEACSGCFNTIFVIEEVKIGCRANVVNALPGIS